MLNIFKKFVFLAFVWALVFSVPSIAAEPRKPSVLFVLTSVSEMGPNGPPTGFTLSEAADPWLVFTKAGFEVDIATINGGAASVHPSAAYSGIGLRHPNNIAFWTDDAIQLKLQHAPAIAKVDATKYDAIYLVGGHGTMWDFPNNKALQRVIRTISDNNGIVGALCHGPSAFIGMRASDGKPFLKGRRVAAFTNDEEREAKLDKVMPFLLEDALKDEGALHLSAPNWQRQVIIDGHLVTGQNPASASAVALEMVKLMGASSIEPSDDETAILAAAKAWTNAYVNRDRAALERALGMDWVFKSGTFELRREEALNGFDTMPHYHSITLSDERVTMINSALAIYSAQEVVLLKRAGATSTERVSSTVLDLFAWREGRWVGIFTEKSR